VAGRQRRGSGFNRALAAELATIVEHFRAWAENRASGKGIDLARAAGAGIHADVLENFKDQFIVVMLKRLKQHGDSLIFPLAEVDDTGSDLVSFNVDQYSKDFHFSLSRKS